MERFLVPLFIMSPLIWMWLPFHSFVLLLYYSHFALILILVVEWRHIVNYSSVIALLYKRNIRWIIIIICDSTLGCNVNEIYKCCSNCLTYDLFILTKRTNEPKWNLFDRLSANVYLNLFSNLLIFHFRSQQQSSSS